MEDPLYNPAPDERPGGFDWGAAGANPAAAQPREDENQWKKEKAFTEL